jgi:hypothetical protein
VHVPQIGVFYIHPPIGPKDEFSTCGNLPRFLDCSRRPHDYAAGSQIRLFGPIGATHAQTQQLRSQNFRAVSGQVSLDRRFDELTRSRAWERWNAKKRLMDQIGFG